MLLRLVICSLVLLGSIEQCKIACAHTRSSEVVAKQAKMAQARMAQTSPKPAPAPRQTYSSPPVQPRRTPGSANVRQRPNNSTGESQAIAPPSQVDPASHSEPIEWQDSEVLTPGLGPVTADCGCDPCNTCMTSCCDPCSEIFWGSAEFLVWWTKEMQVPALVTSSPVGTAQAQAGVLGQPATRIVFGNSGLHDERVGGRFTVGFWFDASRCQGLDLTYLMLDDDAETFRASNSDFPILARPFFNLNTAGEDSRLLAFPGQVQGSIAIETSSDLQTLEALYRQKVVTTPCQQTTVLLGYRFAELVDRVRITESTLGLAGPVAGARFELLDRFSTTNSFHGVEAGVELQWQNGPCWSTNALAKVAVGETTSWTNIAGRTTSTVAGVQTTAGGGLLALPTNIGIFEQSDIGALWEFGFTMRRELCRDLTCNVGYSCLLWTSVQRAGDQIDRNINTTQVPPGVLVGDPRPALPNEFSSYWAQGLRFGFEYAY